MILYDEKGCKVIYNTSNKIGGEAFGDVYMISIDRCLKIFKSRTHACNSEVLSLIKNLKLDNFYEIYDLLHDRRGNFRGYTMKYYAKEEVDILTMPIEYTLDNLIRMYNSILKLTENNVYVSDLHEGNVILDNNNITIIDADLYNFSRIYSDDKLILRNTNAIFYLFSALYRYAISCYHPCYESFDTSEKIRKLFNITSLSYTENISKRLVKYKYPIDYIK